MKIIILTQYYPPEHGAPQNRLHDLAKRWVQSGEDVFVLTAMPNYPGGEIFKEYKDFFIQQEKIDGVKVIRSWIYATKSKRTLFQLLSYLSFVFSSLITGFCKIRSADFLICESPPLFLGFAALMLKIKSGSKLIMNISDLWPESVVQLGMLKPGRILRALEWFEKILYKYSAFVSCQTEGIEKGVKKRCETAATFLFPNGVDLEMSPFKAEKKDPVMMKEFGLPEDSCIVGYGGNHGRSQALEQILEAAKILKDQKIFFALFGDGPKKEELMAKAAEMGLSNLKFYPSQDRQKMYMIQSLWDISVVPLRNIELFDGARPSKMFELMAVGIPFVFCGKGEGAELAKASGCAKIVAPEEAAELSEALRELSLLTPEERLKMGHAGRDFVESGFNRASLAGLFLKRLKESLA